MIPSEILFYGSCSSGRCKHPFVTTFQSLMEHNKDDGLAESGEGLQGGDVEGGGCRGGDDGEVLEGGDKSQSCLSARTKPIT